MRYLVTAALLATLTLPALADEIELVTGEKLQAEVLERSAAGVWLQHPALGKLWVRADQVKSVDGGPLTNSAPPRVDTSDMPAATTAAAEESKNPWKWSLEVGASGKSGNNDTSDLHAAINATQEDADGRWKGEAVYDYAEADKTATKDQKSVRVTRDFKLNDSPWFAFATGRLEWDDFQEWDRRDTIGVGAGRTLIEEADLGLNVRVGIQGIREEGAADDSWRPEGSLGLDGFWQINPEQRLEGSTTYYPDLEESGERRIESALAWSIKLNDANSLRLKLGLKNEYDSHREDPFEKNDFQYYAALLYEF